MEWLNYHHLLYFWTVAKEGGVSRAAEVLPLAQPTLSSQIKKLEKSIGHSLFERSGRTLVLTETGRLVYRYADEIFGLGRELSDVLHNRIEEDRSRFLVGVQGALPKLVAYELLRPALECDENEYQIVCFEGKINELLGELAMHRLDVVIADARQPCPSVQSLTRKMWRHRLWCRQSGSQIQKELSRVVELGTCIIAHPKHFVATPA